MVSLPFSRGLSPAAESCNVIVLTYIYFVKKNFTSPSNDFLFFTVFTYACDSTGKYNSCCSILSKCLPR